MWIQFEHSSGTIKFDTNTFYDLSIPIRKQGNVNCYYLDDPNFTYFESEFFSGNLSKGGSVNCEKISLYPHASGTHTECALHVSDASFDMRTVKMPMLMKCQLLSVRPSILQEDRVIDLQSIQGLNNADHCEAIIFRTIPNTNSKLIENYSGANPPYFDPEVLSKLKAMGYTHLLTDLPSIDRESDEGRLQAHKNWFLTDAIPDASYSITELIYVPDAIPDGYYALNIQIPSIETDAVPSRILIYPCA